MPARPIILNVDDVERVRAVISEILRCAGFEVREAATGAEALRLAAEHPDLILLDIQLPDIDGFDVAERLARAGDPPAVVLVSTRGVSAYRRRLARSPASGFISKSELSGNALSTLVS